MKYRVRGRNVNASMLKRRHNRTRKEAITPRRGGQRPQREGRNESLITRQAVAMGRGDQRQRTLSR